MSSATNNGAPCALVWDMDGTLLDSSGVVPDAFIETVRRLGGANPQRADIVALYSLGPPSSMLSSLLERPCTEDELALYHSLLARVAANATIYSGICTTLDALDDSVPLAVFTGASRRAAGILLTATGLAGHFSTIIGGDEVNRQKPAPDGVLRACASLGVSPNRAVYVGDSPRDLEAARTAGARAVSAGWGHLHDPDAPADLTLRSPEELVPIFSHMLGPSSDTAGSGR